MNLLWSRSYDVIIKTILCGENYIQNAMKKNGTHRTNCFEILGFDILIDSDLKPWLLEANLSPSMACDSPLDMAIKSNLVCDTFNIMGVKRFDRKKESQNKMKDLNSELSKCYVEVDQFCQENIKLLEEIKTLKEILPK